MNLNQVLPFCIVCVIIKCMKLCIYAFKGIRQDICKLVFACLTKIQTSCSESVLLVALIYIYSSLAPVHVRGIHLDHLQYKI